MANDQKQVTGETFQLSDVYRVLDSWDITITPPDYSGVAIGSLYWPSGLSINGAVVTVFPVQPCEADGL